MKRQAVKAGGHFATHHVEPAAQTTTHIIMDACLQLNERLDRLDEKLGQIALYLGRLADRFAPAEADIVDSRYIAEKRGVTVTRVSQIALGGEIPDKCIVDGTGHGKPWKFRRQAVDQWIKDGCPYPAKLLRSVG
jgi:hypothetical protein